MTSTSAPHDQRSVPHSRMWPAAAVLLALLALGGWQYSDWAAHRREHVGEHERFGRALLRGLEGVVERQTRGGVYDRRRLRQALEDVSASFGVEWLALVETVSGSSLAEVGVRPVAPVPGAVFETEVAPTGHRPGGRGPPWADDGQFVALPPGSLRLTLALSTGDLRARLRQADRRALATVLALASVVVLTAVFFAVRARSQALSAALSASRAHGKSLDYLRRLGAGLLHETKNPLGVVRGLAQRMATDPTVSAALRQSAQAIVDETDRTVARLDEFLLLSRPAQIRRERVDVAALFHELVALVDPDLRARDVRLAVHCGSAWLDADRDQIRRLLLNLLLNAVREVGPGGHIRLACETTERGLVLAVEDDGPGVPESLRETMFEPYVSGRPGGTGLGLSIAQRIALDHGFRLRHEPNVPRGARMLLEVGSA
ncbi:MAG: HAMP domain-containing sensor histidine kinase [Planctomycetota bacterium]